MSKQTLLKITLWVALKPLAFAILFLFILPCAAESPDHRPTICLNMIVKDEKDVITRCLGSVLPIIDYWVIVDTGSTDGTQETIKEFMFSKGVPGELIERPWKNFGHNRNEALEFARGKGDYVFFIDADEFLLYAPDFKLPALDKDYYYGTLSYSALKYSRIKLIKNTSDWKWVGVLHEVMCPAPSATFAHLEGMTNMITTEGARSKDPKKFEKDAQILEDALKEEPESARYVFYLAQSYRDAQNYPLALKNYERRVEMGGWNEEVYCAQLQVGLLQETLEMPSETVVRSFVKASQLRNTRVEPYYYMAKHFREQQKHELGYQLAKIAVKVPESKDVLFVQQWIHDYGAQLELSINAYWIGKYEECQQISLELLKNKELPVNVRECVERNLGFANMKLLENAAVL